MHRDNTLRLTSVELICDQKWSITEGQLLFSQHIKTKRSSWRVSLSHPSTVCQVWLRWVQLPWTHFSRHGGPADHTILHQSGKHWDQGERPLNQFIIFLATYLLFSLHHISYFLHLINIFCTIIDTTFLQNIMLSYELYLQQILHFFWPIFNCFAPYLLFSALYLISFGNKFSIFFYTIFNIFLQHIYSFLHHVSQFS